MWNTWQNQENISLDSETENDDAGDEQDEETFVYYKIMNTFFVIVVDS